jgi:hypothetical protein
MPIEITSYQSATPSLATLENETVEQLIAGINQVSPINTNTASILSNAPMVLPLNYGTQSYYQVPYNYPLQCNYFNDFFFEKTILKFKIFLVLIQNTSSGSSYFNLNSISKRF